MTETPVKRTPCDNCQRPATITRLVYPESRRGAMILEPRKISMCAACELADIEVKMTKNKSVNELTD
jgi:hypothetical protein